MPSPLRGDFSAAPVMWVHLHVRHAGRTSDGVGRVELLWVLAVSRISYRSAVQAG